MRSAGVLARLPRMGASGSRGRFEPALGRGAEDDGWGRIGSRDKFAKGPLNICDAMARVLVIDGDEGSRTAIVAALREEHFVLEVRDVRNGLFCLAAERWDVLVLDPQAPGSKELPVLEQMKELHTPRPEVVLLAPRETVISSFPIRASLTRPIDPSQLRIIVANAAQVRQLRGAQVLDLIPGEAASDAEQALRAKAQQLADICANAPGVVFRLLVTPQGDRLFTFVSSRCSELMEVSEQRLLEDAAQFDGLIHPEERERFSTLWSWAERAGIRFRFEGRLLLPSGRIRWVQCLAEPKPANLATVAWDGIITDISERMAYQSSALLADRLTTLRVMASSVWQEVCRPLLAVRSALEGIEAQLATLRERGAQDCLHHAVHGVQGLERALADLSTFAHFPSGRACAVDVRRILDTAIRLLRSEIRQRAQLQCDYRDESWVVADEASLGQVFFDLLLLAVRSIPKGHPSKHTLRVSLQVVGERVRVEIANTSSEVPTVVLDPSFATPAASVSLYTCDMILESLGGQLELRPRRGHGNRIVVNLLRGAAPQPHLASSIAHLRVVSDRAHRVLVVDSDELTHESLSGALDGYDVAWLRSGREAIDRIERDGPFDLVLCAIDLPDLTGADVYAAARRSHPGSERRVVFLSDDPTGTAAPVASSAAPALGLQKPLTRHHVHQLVRRLRGTSASAPRR